MNLLRLSVWSCWLACFAAGCAAFDDSHEDHWRTMTVVSVVRRADVPASVDTHCADARHAGSDDQVAVLQFRGARALHLQAFVLPEATDALVGRRLLANGRLCQVRTE